MENPPADFDTDVVQSGITIRIYYIDVHSEKEPRFHLRVFHEV